MNSSVDYSLFLNKSILISKVTTTPILISNNPIAIWGEGKIIFEFFSIQYLIDKKIDWKNL